MAEGRKQPHEWGFRTARDRYLKRRGADATDASIKAWRYRLKLFAEWCEGIGLESVGELQPLDLDEYYDVRATEIKPVTLEGEMWTLHQFIEYLESVGAVQSGLAEAVRIPDVPEAERSSDVKLATDAALALLRQYRAGYLYGTRNHVLLELLWTIGARQGAIRGLDLQDVHLEDAFVEFRHRPETGTPLKNDLDTERPVGIPDATVDALGHYIREERYDSSDDHGRLPLIASQQGRPHPNSIRNWTYQATEPCLHTACPHGRDRESCDWVQYNHASKCPSSRAPHHVRTGSITWQLNLGFPPSVVAERVGADVDTIKNHYDVADREERRRRERRNMEQNRRPYLDRLENLNDPDN